MLERSTLFHLESSGFACENLECDYPEEKQGTVLNIIAAN